MRFAAGDSGILLGRNRDPSRSLFVERQRATPTAISPSLPPPLLKSKFSLLHWAKSSPSTPTDPEDPGLRRRTQTPFYFSPSVRRTSARGNLHPNPRPHGAPRERRNVNPRPNRESTNRYYCEAGGRAEIRVCSPSRGRCRVRSRGNGTTRSDGCESVCVCVDRQRRQPC